MSAISAVGAQPSFTQASDVRPPSPTTKPGDTDGDRDSGRSVIEATTGILRVTA